MLFEPTATTSLEDFTGLKDFLILSILDDVLPRRDVWRYDGSWTLLSTEGGQVEAQGTRLCIEHNVM